MLFADHQMKIKLSFSLLVEMTRSGFRFTYTANGGHPQREDSKNQTHENADVDVIGHGPASLASQEVWFLPVAIVSVTLCAG
jgi:hypothetical protein